MVEARSSTKNVLLRLDTELAERVTALAEVEGRAVSEIMRQAIAEHVERRRSDPEFQRRLKAAVTRQRRLLRLLEADDR